MLHSRVVDEFYIGIDEVGRGPWAGPLVSVAAYGRDRDVPTRVTDSKSLSQKVRDDLHQEIVKSVRLSIGWTLPAELDELGLSAATSQAMELAVLNLNQVAPIYLDGNVDYLPNHNVELVPKGDLSVPLIGAASIVAKQLRDRYMQHIDSCYPEFGFGAHVGYGTKQHKVALEKYGPSQQHRRSFKPVQRLISEAEL